MPGHAVQGDGITGRGSDREEVHRGAPGRVYDNEVVGGDMGVCVGGGGGGWGGFDGGGRAGGETLGGYEVGMVVSV